MRPNDGKCSRCDGVGILEGVRDEWGFGVVCSTCEGTGRASGSEATPEADMCVVEVGHGPTLAVWRSVPQRGEKMIAVCDHHKQQFDTRYLHDDERDLVWGPIVSEDTRT